MIRNPYNITLSSTKRNIFTILLAVIIIIVGFLLMQLRGFDNTYTLSKIDSDITDGFSYQTDIYVVNFIFALIIIIVALAIILVRHDLLGIISGIALFAFIFFALVVGVKYTSGGIRGVHERENITLTTMLIQTLSK